MARRTGAGRRIVQRKQPDREVRTTHAGHRRPPKRTDSSSRRMPPRRPPRQSGLRIAGPRRTQSCRAPPRWGKHRRDALQRGSHEVNCWLGPTIASVFDLQSYSMFVPKLSYSIGGGSADAGPPTVKARPTAAAMAATIRAIFIPTPVIRTQMTKKGRQMTPSTSTRGLEVDFLIPQENGRTYPKLSLITVR
jgi:hypothetical protein